MEKEKQTFNSQEVMSRFKDEFTRQLVAGELEFDRNTRSETISCTNREGQLIKVMRPSIDVEASELMNELVNKIIYIAKVSVEASEPLTEDGKHHLFIFRENGEVNLLDAEGEMYQVIDNEIAHRVFDGAFVSSQ